VVLCARLVCRVVSDWTGVVGYQLGVDLGTTYSAAAVGRDGRVEMATLGAANPVLPSVVLLRADGEVLIGDVAVRRGLGEPSRVGREFKRRLGDPTPLVLGGTPYAAEALMGHLLRGIVGTVVAREGEVPQRVVLTHPATYGPYKLEQLREVARLGGLDLGSTLFLTEPQAAAISYASRSRVDVGEVVAVYDLGGGTFDVALVQRTVDGFSIVGRPEGMERFGGIDIDAAIVVFVDQCLDGALSRLDPNDGGVQAGFARLRDDCRAAKEALSGDTDTSITVAVPGLQTEVRLTRGELENMVRPRLQETVDALERAVASAGLTMEGVSRILLVGGSSRIPLIGDYLRRRTGRPVAVDAHPKFAIALGAAGLGLTSGTQTEPVPAPVTPAPAAAAPPPPPVVAPAPPPPVAAPPPPPVAAPPPTPFVALPTPPSPSGGPSSSRPKLLVAAGVVAVVAIAIVAFVATRGGNERTATDNTTLDTTDTTDTTDTSSAAGVADITAAAESTATSGTLAAEVATSLTIATPAVTSLPESTLAPTTLLSTTSPPTTVADPCPVELVETVPGGPGQATLYQVSLPAELVGSRVRLIVDNNFNLDTQTAHSTIENLAWQTGDPMPSATAAQIVAVVDSGDGTAQVSSCPISPGVITTQLGPEQSVLTGDAGALTAFQVSLDTKVGTNGTPQQGYGDTVRSLALPSGTHTILVAYQRNRCLVAATCSATVRVDPAGIETTSLFCIDINGTKFNIVEGVEFAGRMLDAYQGWPTLAQITIDFGSWCQ